jgi:hypothetical protein
VVRQLVKNAQTAIQQVQEDMRKAENTGLTTREPQKTIEEMMIAICDTLNDLSKC